MTGLIKISGIFKIAIVKRVRLAELCFEQRYTQELIVEGDVNVLFDGVKVVVGDELELYLGLDGDFGQGH